MSDKTVAQKLLLKPGQRLLLRHAPDGWLPAPGPWPDGVNLLTAPTEPADIVLAFVTTRAQLEAELTELKAALAPAGILWIAYPKGTSRATTDINRDSIRAYAQATGLQAVSIFAIDDTWSALRLKVV
jgi:hypothetical protein